MSSDDRAQRGCAAIVRAVGHDLSAPLAAIRIAAESMTSQVGTPSLVAQGEHLQQLARNAEALVSDLVRVSQQGEFSPELHLQIVNLSDVIRETVGDISVSRQVELDLDDVDAAVDPDAIARIVVKIVTNAVRHTPRHTLVSVSLTAVDDDAVIEVRDLGPGIPVSERERLIRPFERNTPIGEEAGSGLGLTIADLLARAHGGTLTIGSNDPLGTVVSITLPVRSPLAGGSGIPGEAP